MSQSELGTSIKRRFLGCLTVTGLAFIGVGVGWAFFTGYLPIRFFDSEDWKAANYWDGTRVEMIEHLQWSGNLDGLSEMEVVELLGAETESTYFQEYDLVYALGPERGFLSLDSEWLVIDLDNDGVVADYHVVRD